MFHALSWARLPFALPIVNFEIVFLIKFDFDEANVVMVGGAIESGVAIFDWALRISLPLSKMAVTSCSPPSCPSLRRMAMILSAESEERPCIRSSALASMHL